MVERSNTSPRLRSEHRHQLKPVQDTPSGPALSRDARVPSNGRGTAEPNAVEQEVIRVYRAADCTR